MKDKTYFYVSGILFVLGILAYAIYQEYIIINPKKSFLTVKTENTTNKKKVILYFYKNNWQQDYVHLLFSENKAQNAQLLVNRWLEIAHEEGISKKKISLQNAFIIMSEQELILSFDNSLFGKESSTFDKWMFIEGILKTIKENMPTIKKVRFLLLHQPLIDTHLDFSNAWPVSGFA